MGDELRMSYNTDGSSSKAYQTDPYFPNAGLGSGSLSVLVKDVMASSGIHALDTGFQFATFNGRLICLWNKVYPAAYEEDHITSISLSDGTVVFDVSVANTNDTTSQVAKYSGVFGSLVIDVFNTRAYLWTQDSSFNWTLRAYNPETGSLIWSRSFGVSQPGPITCIPGRIFVFSGIGDGITPGNMYSVSPYDGSSSWIVPVTFSALVPNQVDNVGTTHRFTLGVTTVIQILNDGSSIYCLCQSTITDSTGAHVYYPVLLVKKMSISDGKTLWDNTDGLGFLGFSYGGSGTYSRWLYQSATINNGIFHAILINSKIYVVADSGPTVYINTGNPLLVTVDASAGTSSNVSLGFTGWIFNGGSEYGSLCSDGTYFDLFMDAINPTVGHTKKFVSVTNGVVSLSSVGAGVIGILPSSLIDKDYVYFLIQNNDLSLTLQRSKKDFSSIVNFNVNSVDSATPDTKTNYLLADPSTLGIYIIMGVPDASFSTSGFDIIKF